MKKYLLDKDFQPYVLNEQLSNIVGRDLRIGCILETPVLRLDSDNLPWVLEELLYSHYSGLDFLKKWRRGEVAFFGFPKNGIFKAKILLPHKLSGELIDLLSSESLIYLRFRLNHFPPLLKKSYPLYVCRESDLGSVKDDYFVLQIVKKKRSRIDFYSSEY